MAPLGGLVDFVEKYKNRNDRLDNNIKVKMIRLDITYTENQNIASTAVLQYQCTHKYRYIY